MIAVGILGFPFIGAIQEKTTTAELAAGPQSALVQQISSEKHYVLGAYQAIDPDKAAALTDRPRRTPLRPPTARPSSKPSGPWPCSRPSCSPAT